MNKSSAKCSACNTPLSQEGDSVGLCPGCLLELALDDTSFEAEVLVDPEEAPTLQYSGYTFEEGQIQGERYRVRSLLGRGGMGEVWRAYDLKLRQDVALKALRTELIEDTDALETLRQEVRTAREVISPNVCRVFDLQELDGQELVSMEYIDGTTLQEILKDRSPLDLDEAREIASQFLAGLEAIHEAGLVHRDIKPENVMVTRTGRVVVMDFGIAKGLGDGKGGLIAGTPAYMSPEQAKGEELDARADVFSVGVVLAEMVAPGGVHSLEDRQRVWEAIHLETPEIEETHWSRVISRCVTQAPDGRYATAAELARALEEVTLRAVGDDLARVADLIGAEPKEYQPILDPEEILNPEEVPADCGALMVVRRRFRGNAAQRVRWCICPIRSSTRGPSWEIPGGYPPFRCKNPLESPRTDLGNLDALRRPASPPAGAGGGARAYPDLPIDHIPSMAQP